MLQRIAAVAAMALGLAVAPAVVGVGTRAIAQDAGETALWDRVKNSRDPADVRSYLERYPNGAFAALARIRLRNLGGGSGPAAGAPPVNDPPARAQGRDPLPGPSVGQGRRDPLPPPRQVERAPSGSEPALTSATAIREVQDRLYALNYQVRTRNGRLTAETRDAIRAWQRQVSLPVTGELSLAQLAQLRRARLPTNWGALAYYAKGANATVWRRTSRAQAERDALVACRKRAGARCTVVTVADSGCAALGFYNAIVSRRQYWGAYGIVRPTLGQATAEALSQCKANSRSPSSCGIRTTVCADGSHSR